jgi:DHA1 family multidrug resistance protein-like MFS transporter
VRARGGRTGTGASATRAGGTRLSFGLGKDVSYLFWSLSIFNFGFGLYAYLFTIYLEDLGASAFQIGLLVGVQGLLRIAVNLPAGILVDRFSRKKIILVTTLITIPSALSYGLAQTWWQALPGMLIIVLGNLGTPAFSSYLAEAGAETNRARAFSMVYVIGPSVALALSPVTGGWLAGATSYRVVFFASGAAFAISLIVLTRLSERPMAHHGGTAASYGDAIAVPVIRAVAGLQFGVLAVLMIGTTLLPNYLKEVHHIGIGTIGWFGSIAAVGSALLSLAVARVKVITTIRTIGLAPICVGLLCGVTLLTGNPLLLAAAFLGRGGFMVAWSLFAAVLSDTAPPKLLSRAFAFSEFLGSIGLALAPFAAGALYDWRRGSPLLVTCIATPFLAAMAFWFERRYVRPAIHARTTETDRGAPTAAVAEGVA